MEREEVVVLLRRAGLTLPAEQLDELVRASGYVEAMLERVRAAEVDEEPALVFAPPETPA